VTHENRIYVFERFRLDLVKRKLFEEDLEVELKGKPFEILHYIVRRQAETPGVAIHKEEVIKEVWGRGRSIGTEPEAKWLENLVNDRDDTLRTHFTKIYKVLGNPPVVDRDENYIWLRSEVRILETSDRVVPESIEADVLTQSRRRCCLCFRLDADYRIKRGRVVCVDSARNDQAGFAFLCEAHLHGFSLDEVKSYRTQLYGEITRLDEVTSQVRVDLWESQEKRALNSLLDLIRDFRIEDHLARQLLNAARIEESPSPEAEEVRRRVAEVVDFLRAHGNTESALASRTSKLSPDWRGPIRGTASMFLQGTVAIAGEHISLGFSVETSRPFTLRCDQLNISFGQVTAVLGPNSSGKTTLLRILTGELRPQLGSISYPGIDTSTDWYSIKQRMAYVSQTPQRWYGTVEQQLAFEAAAIGKRARDVDEAVELLLSRFDLYQYRHSDWDSLSPGLITRFELAKAVLRDPMILVMDEPLAHLDASGREAFLDDVWRLSRSSNRPLAVIMSSQHVYEVEHIADRLVLLDHGQVTVSPVLDSESRCLELCCSEGVDALQSMLGTSVTIDPREIRGLYWIMHSAGDKLRIIRELIQHEVDISYLRDISKSSVRLFK
jgi:ABC-2 type transport system ATP-binding protein